jgi:transcriptional regulator with XRE-family HTH domain
VRSPRGSAADPPVDLLPFRAWFRFFGPKTGTRRGKVGLGAEEGVMRKDDGGAVPNVALFNLRDGLAQSQEDVADALNALAAARGEATAIAGNHISRWEQGIVFPSPLYRQLLAEHFRVSVAELGLVRQKVIAPVPSVRTVGDALSMGDATSEDRADVAQSQERWLWERRQITVHHTALTEVAARLYPREHRVGELALIARPGWILAEPVDLTEVGISLTPDVPPPLLDGTEDASSGVRPLRAGGSRYHRYSRAIRDLARPTLFENRPSWRLVGAGFTRSGGALAFGQMMYFDAMDTCEAIAHEAAAVHVVNGDMVRAPTWRGLNFRKAVGDPFDLGRRPLLMSINTLTIRLDRSGSASVVLHDRDAASVATSGGVVGVMPAGVFQPSTVRAGDHAPDFDLWRNIMREYSEEFLGNPEHSGGDAAADYAREPFRSLDAARRDGGIRVHCFGLALGALDLWGGLETVAVFDAEVFDDIFVGLVRRNDEGSVVRVGAYRPTALVPFTQEAIDELHGSRRIAPETSFSLRSAWQHREQLLRIR